jgi:N-acetylmuramoyl-L-alanine amidase
LKNNKVSFTISERDDPYRITISVNTASEGGLAGIPTWRKNNIELVIIDPGHGGKDPGAVGRKYKTEEKDIVLDISRRVAKILRKNGFEVKLTRDKDVFIPLGERTNFANRLGADLFVSIHANASVKTHPRGNETFFLARAKTDEARAVAALENSAIRFEQENSDIMEAVGDLDFILMDIVQNEYLKESSELAEMIQKEFDRKMDIPNRGVDQAGFYVLNRAYMPAVLVETAFISNEAEEKLLRRKSFRQDIAESIARGIMSFKQKYQISSR